MLKFTESGSSSVQQLESWLDDICQTIWDCTAFEIEMIPSKEALHLHWQRACWVMDMWRQADQNIMTLQPITEYGPTLTDNKLCVVWDSTLNIEAIRQRIQILTRGCKCVTGCSTGRCGCKKNKKSCSEGCHINCNNLSVVAASAGREDNGMELMDVVVEEEVATPDDIEEMDELMDWIFCEEQESACD